jgi:TonB-linked SusC/RagA family outer membrane protein
VLKLKTFLLKFVKIKTLLYIRICLKLLINQNSRFMKKILMIFVLAIASTALMLGQTVHVRGTITGSEDGLGIPGVSISVKGTTVGTMSDNDGKYAIDVPQSAKILVFSFVGMKAQEIDITGKSVVDVVMQPDMQMMDEVVVTALGISKEKKALGYAVQDVKNEEIVRTGNSDFAGAIQGKVAGVDIKPSSGMPGASSQIVIRGARSFTGSNTPLYVIDGMPIASDADYSTGNSVTGSDISNRAVDLNPSDIESINVLKGQAAAALYGIRASNGVIVITTKSGRGNKAGKPIVSFSHTSTFSQVSRTPEYQKTYAQGSYGTFGTNTSYSWGCKIADLPDDPTVGGNSQGHPGKYYVLQLDEGGVADPWVTPKVYNSWNDFFKTGYTVSNNINVSQANTDGSFDIGLGQTSQDGIAPSTGMDRWNAKATAERKLSKNFTAGFSTNFSTISIDKLPGANDAVLNGVLSSPPNYNLKGWPSSYPGDQYSQIYFRALSFDNPYWAVKHNKFTENTDRFFGNSYVNYLANLSSNMTLKIRYQLGMDSYTTHFQDIFEYGHANKLGSVSNYGVTDRTVNSLTTANFDWNINSDFVFNAMLGNEINQDDSKYYSESGKDFNFGGWTNIDNANTVTAGESKYKSRTVGFFNSLSLSYKSMLFLNGTGRYDIVSTMPRGNRSFFYPSVSLGFVASELPALKQSPWLSFAKIRGCYAEVGQAGRYVPPYYDKPGYSGGFWTGSPIVYPIGGVNSYVPSSTLYDPSLKPQNTKSYEIGTELKFFNNRLGIDYTFSRQNVKDQIFQVPLAGSTGASSLMMNAGRLHTISHEIILYITPIMKNNFRWDMTVNFSKVHNEVDELANGVESIFLGGFTTPQVRAGIGATYPVIYGSTFLRDAKGKIIVNDDPTAYNHGMPQTGAPGVIGVVSPDFILGATNSFSYKGWSLTAVIEWKNGGKMYSGSNGLMDGYGVSKRTEDRESTFVYDGVKPDGTVNDIERGGPGDPDAVQDLYQSVLTSVDEYFIHDNSFVKLRELSLKYKPAKKFFNAVDLGVSVFARNFLIWSALPNFDPESSQGNNNMGGSFERFSMPQAKNVGFSLDITF